MNLDSRYVIGDGVELRREPFGGIVYRHDTRRLYFLRSAELVEFLFELDGTETMRTRLDSFLASHGFESAYAQAFAGSLSHLSEIGVLHEL